jgi:hypothetical protein
LEKPITLKKIILSLIGKKQAFLVVYLGACHTMTNTRVFEIKGKYWEKRSRHLIIKKIRNPKTSNSFKDLGKGFVMLKKRLMSLFLILSKKSYICYMFSPKLYSINCLNDFLKLFYFI